MIGLGLSWRSLILEDLDGFRQKYRAEPQT